MGKVDKEELKILEKIFWATGSITNAVNLLNLLESKKGDYSRIDRDKNNKVIIICHSYKYGDVELSHSVSMFILKGRNKCGNLKDEPSSPATRYHNYYHMKKGER